MDIKPEAHPPAPRQRILGTLRLPHRKRQGESWPEYMFRQRVRQGGTAKLPYRYRRHSFL